MRRALPYILIALVLFVAAGLYIDSRGPSPMDMDHIIPQKNTIQSVDDVKFENYGKAPEFAGITQWLNLPAGRQALTMASLRGKIVLVDFWTYSCINCIRTLPYITKWYDTYKDMGLVVVGVHTPEFAFEKVTDNVKTAIERHKINYPVAQDNDYGTWQAFTNQYWPAKYLIDQEGKVVYTHFGEGDYNITEAAIRKLLKLDSKTPSNDTVNELPSLSGARSPEMYFGYSREEHMPQTYKPNVAQRFDWLRGQEMNQYQLEGTWKIENERAILQSESGRIRLGYKGSEVNMVASSPNGSKLKILVNNVEQTPVMVKGSQLYTLFKEDAVTEHELIIEITGSGFEAFTFTFG